MRKWWRPGGPSASSRGWRHGLAGLCRSLKGSAACSLLHPADHKRKAEPHSESAWQAAVKTRQAPQVCGGPITVQAPCCAAALYGRGRPCAVRMPADAPKGFLRTASVHRCVHESADASQSPKKSLLDKTCLTCRGALRPGARRGCAGLTDGKITSFWLEQGRQPTIRPAMQRAQSGPDTKYCSGFVTSI